VAQGLKSFLCQAPCRCQPPSFWWVAPERRCSSRTFRYGYLVTT